MRLVWRGDERVTIKRLPSFFLDVVKHIAFTLINDKVFFFLVFCGICEITESFILLLDCVA